MQISVANGTTAAITKKATERQSYEGRGDARRVVGRLTDEAGRPVSGANGVAVAPGVGLLADATVLAPDVYGEVMQEGAVVRLVGDGMTAKLSGADFGAIRVTISGVERVEPIGSLADVLAAAEAGARAGAKGDAK